MREVPQLTADLVTGAATLNFSFITPNLCNDGHDGDGTRNLGKGCKNGDPGGLTSADAFLARWVPAIMASAAYKGYRRGRRRLRARRAGVDGVRRRRVDWMHRAGPVACLTGLVCLSAQAGAPCQRPPAPAPAVGTFVGAGRVPGRPGRTVPGGDNRISL